MYFSALKKRAKDDAITFIQQFPPASFTDRHLIGRSSVVFRHDIVNGLPIEYNYVDVLYSDIVWPKGMKVFNEAAEAGTDYEQYMGALVSIIKSVRVPVFIVAGMAEQKRFESANDFRPITLNGDRAWLYSWRETVKSNEAVKILKEIARGHDRIGDFCCGLGRTGKVFYDLGKSFVMSDINGRCVTAIVEDSKEWEKRRPEYRPER